MDRDTLILVLFAVFLLAAFLWFCFNPAARRIRKIQSLLNKDRTICDFINSLDGWQIDNINKDGLCIAINPEYMPLYYLYITYRGKRPTNEEIKILHHEMTKEDSIVTLSHKVNMPVEWYINWQEKLFNTKSRK